jgi:hypothetical protein
MTKSDPQQAFCGCRACNSAILLIRLSRAAVGKVSGARPSGILRLDSNLQPILRIAELCKPGTIKRRFGDRIFWCDHETGDVNKVANDFAELLDDGSES